MLLGGFLSVAQAWRLPLAVLEIAPQARGKCLRPRGSSRSGSAAIAPRSIFATSKRSGACGLMSRPAEESDRATRSGGRHGARGAATGRSRRRRPLARGAARAAAVRAGHGDPAFDRLAVSRRRGAGAHHRSDHTARRESQGGSAARLAAPGAGAGRRATGAPADLVARGRGAPPRPRRALTVAT